MFAKNKHCQIIHLILITELNKSQSKHLLHTHEAWRAKRSVLSDTWWAGTGGALLTCTTHMLPPSPLWFLPASAATCPFTSTPERLTRIRFVWMRVCVQLYACMCVCGLYAWRKMGYGLSERRLFNHVSATGQWRAGRGKGGWDSGEERVRR